MKFRTAVASTAFIICALWTVPSHAAGVRTTEINPGGHVRLTPDRSVSSSALRSTYSRTTTVQPTHRLNRRYDDVVIYNGNRIDGGRSVEFDLRFPDDSSRTRTYHAGPRIRYHPPQITDRETIVVEPRVEYDVRGIGNVTRVERQYTTRTRRQERTPAVYDVFAIRNRGGDPANGRDGVAAYRRHGVIVEETETSVEPLSAQRSNLPHFKYVRMIGSDGKAHLIPSEQLRDVYQSPPDLSGENAGDYRGVWIPQLLALD